jgi:alpha-1,3-mannosyl-glycoprotein beta-1,2-N-acetylglucosaminyltransferase
MKYAFQSVILTEDDLTISVDFFDYFKAMHKIIIQDPTLFCVSAWNDNGKSDLIDLKAAGNFNLVLMICLVLKI